MTKHLFRARGPLRRFIFLTKCKCGVHGTGKVLVHVFEFGTFFLKKTTVLVFATKTWTTFWHAQQCSNGLFAWEGGARLIEGHLLPWITLLNRRRGQSNSCRILSRFPNVGQETVKGCSCDVWAGNCIKIIWDCHIFVGPFPGPPQNSLNDVPQCPAEGKTQVLTLHECSQSVLLS